MWDWHIFRLLQRRRGATGFNYALLVGLIAIVALASLTNIGEAINHIFNALFDEQEQEEAIIEEGNQPPVITFAQAGLEEGGITITTGMPPELPQPEPVDLTNIQFTVTDDTTPPEEIITAVTVIYDPDYQGSNLSPLPEGEITGEGEERALSLGEIDQQQNINAMLIVTLTATDSDDLTSETSFPVRVNPFVVMTFKESWQVFPAVFTDNVDLVNFGFSELWQEFPAIFTDEVELVNSGFTELWQEYPAIFTDEVELVNSGFTELWQEYLEPPG